MRLSVASLRRVVKGDLTIQFVPQALTSYGGLELLRRYLRRIELVGRLRDAFRGLRSDYGGARLALVILALFYVGARRLEHLRFLGGDPLVARFCGLARLPTRRTFANWLRQYSSCLANVSPCRNSRCQCAKSPYWTSRSGNWGWRPSVNAS